MTTVEPPDSAARPGPRREASYAERQLARGVQWRHLRPALRLRETMMRSWKAAVSFPTEIVEADRWMQQRSTLNGQQLVLFDHHEFVSHSRTFIDHNHFVRAGPAFHGGSVAGGYHGGGGFHGGGGHGGGGHR